jgi:hypothetical protein
MKNIGKKLGGVAVAAALSLAAPLAGAMDIGLGANLNTDGNGYGGWGFSVPLRFGNIMVEPSVEYDSWRYQDTYNGGTYIYDGKGKYYVIDTGIYWIKPIIPMLDAYIGGRVGLYSGQRSYYETCCGSWQSQYRGAYVGPTIGAEYFFSKKFSVGLDVSVLFSSEHSSNDDSNYAGGSYKDTTTQTRTKLRFYF